MSRGVSESHGKESLPSNFDVDAPVTGGRHALIPRRVMSARTANTMASRALEGTPSSSEGARG